MEEETVFSRSGDHFPPQTSDGFYWSSGVNLLPYWGTLHVSWTFPQQSVEAAHEASFCEGGPNKCQCHMCLDLFIVSQQINNNTSKRASFSEKTVHVFWMSLSLSCWLAGALRCLLQHLFSVWWSPSWQVYSCICPQGGELEKYILGRKKGSRNFLRVAIALHVK